MGEDKRVKLKNEGFYGVVTLPSSTFDKLNKEFFIVGSQKDLVFMCANPEETEHLYDLGVEMDADFCCDWYKLKRARDEKKI